MNGNDIAWLGLGVPAILAWLAAGLAWLLAPHLATEPDSLVWAMWSALGWYGAIIALMGGWCGILLLSAGL